MIQDDVTQRRVVMRGATDTCCSQWAPVLPPVAVLTSVASPDRLDSGDASSHRTESDVQESIKK